MRYDKVRKKYKVFKSKKDLHKWEFKTFLKYFLLPLLLTLILCLCSPLWAAECSKWDSLSDEQRYRLEHAYNYGKQYDLGWTLSSIVLHESHAGLYVVNTKSKDFGIAQVNLTTAKNIMGIKGYWNEQALITKMVVDNEFNLYLALHVLQHFGKVNNSWKDVIRSYNEGNLWKRNSKSSKKSLDYYKKIVNNLNILKKCSNFN